MIAARIDTNQPEIVKALRAAGATVQHLHTVGHGCPDLVVGFRGVNYLVEIKRPGKKLTPDERAWHAGWGGQVIIVETVQQALEMLNG